MVTVAGLEAKIRTILRAPAFDRCRRITTKSYVPHLRKPDSSWRGRRGKFFRGEDKLSSGLRNCYVRDQV